MLELRVFKGSPAIALYKRNGFMVNSEEERFINMRAKI
jgi:ribosomal protein S18 acetylase RimI-like enzyme